MSSTRRTQSPPEPPDPSTPEFSDPIPRIIPFGSLTFFSGASGVGKTVMLADWCRRLRDAHPIWGHDTNPPIAFCYICGDRPWAPTFAETFADAGFSDMPHYSLADDERTNPKEWQAQKGLNLVTYAVEQANPIPGTFLIIDPTAPLFIQGDQNRARDVATSLHWYRRLIRKYQITLVCCANQAKAKEDDEYVRAQDRIAGSGAFVAYSDTQIYMLPPKGEGYPTTLGWTPRRAAAEEFKVEFDPATRLFIPYTGLLQPDGPNDAQVLDERIAKVLVHIPEEGTITTGELAELTKDDFSLTTLHRILRTMEACGMILRPRHGHIARRKAS